MVSEVGDSRLVLLNVELLECVSTRVNLIKRLIFIPILDTGVK